MKVHTKKVLAIAMAITLLSCQEEQKTGGDGTPQQPGDIAATANQTEGQNVVRLDNGKKWAANPETTAGIRKMEAELESLPASAGQEEYKTVQSRMVSEFDQLVKACTMTGEAHDQLHNYILPLRQMIGRLDADDHKVRAETRTNLKAYLAEYDRYFE